MSGNSLKRKAGITALSLAGVCLLLLILLPLPRFEDGFSTAVLDRRGSPLRVFLAPDDHWRLPADSLPSKYRAALLRYEDRRYYWHPGVDPFSLGHALVECARAGGFVRGASTIPMQVARLTSPKERTPLNKLYEMAQAVKLSLLRSKESILLTYAAHAPMGGNTVGLRAACLRWFDKEPSLLSWSEAALLAVLPNSPSLANSPAGRVLLTAKRDRLLRLLHEDGRFDRPELLAALAEPVPDRWRQMPFDAPHASCWLQVNERGPIPDPVIVSTLDRSLQRSVDGAVSSYLQRLKRYGINNTAVLVAETATGAVRAYAGSQDFASTEAWGQVDGVRAPRSTGSLLKPFLYASLLDDGDYLPGSLVRDVPAFFGGFVPVNAGNEYLGMVPLGEALLHSLNVPAVMLLQHYGIARFQHLLERGGMSTLFRPPDGYGLTLILGGAEGTLWDMCGLYRSLARGGVVSPLHLTEGEEQPSDTTRLFSAGAAWQILEILKDLNRPGNEYYWRQFQDQRPIAWKTGTSFGQRDAWAIGVTPQWTIGVWVGNFNGVGNPELGGARSAGPLLFDVLSRLPEDNGPGWFDCPEYDLKNVTVCAESGFPAGPKCPHTKDVFAPLHSRQSYTCPYHTVVYTGRESHYQLCSLCWEHESAGPDTLLILPPDAAAIMRGRGRRPDQLPRHNPACPTQAGQNPITIVYPAPESGVWIPRQGRGRSGKVVLKAAHSNAEANLYWYLDGSFLGESRENHELAVSLHSGDHRLTLVDGQGHSRMVAFHVASSGD